MMAYIVTTIFGLAFLGIGACLLLVLKGKHQGPPPPIEEMYDPFENDDHTSPVRDYLIGNIWYGISDDNSIDNDLQYDLDNQQI